MTEFIGGAGDEVPTWRRLIDFPLVALAIAIGLFLFAREVGAELGSVMALPFPLTSMLVRNATILVTVLLAYKLVIVRLGAAPRDDLIARQAWPNLAIGLLIGFLLMASSVAIAAIAHVYKLTGEGDSSHLIEQLVTSAIMPAFMEELLFRGILFRWIEEFAGSWAALLITAVLFGLVHILNPGATWFSSLAIAVEAGFLLGGAYMLTRSLWLPMGLHAAWNFTQGEVFDVPVSGIAEHGLLKAKMSGPALLSGGPFGLEASIIGIAVATAAGIWFVGWAVKRGELVPPWWLGRRR